LCGVHRLRRLCNMGRGVKVSCGLRVKRALLDGESCNGLLEELVVELSKLVVRGGEVDNRLLQLLRRRVLDWIGIHGWRLEGTCEGGERAGYLYLHEKRECKLRLEGEGVKGVMLCRCRCRCRS
jgi:hypothetical protein